MVKYISVCSLVCCSFVNKTQKNINTSLLLKKTKISICLYTFISKPTWIPFVTKLLFAPGNVINNNICEKKPGIGSHKKNAFSPWLIFFKENVPYVMY